MSEARVATNGFTVRHYCQGIGDCHLLKFSKADGKAFWMLVDCGIHTSIAGGSKILDAIVADIGKTTGGRIDVLVLTHEHTDHNSGFDPNAARFANITVGEVWMAWTESDKDAQALKLDQFKQQALNALSQTSARLNAAANLAPRAQSLRTVLDSLLAFNFGAQGERVRGFRKGAEALQTQGIRYLEPKNPPLTFKGVPNLRMYVLAPSRDETYLKILERAGEMYQLADDQSLALVVSSLVSAMASNANVGSLDDLAAPFDPSTGNDLSALASPPADAKSVPFQDFARDHYFGPAKRLGPAVSSRIRKSHDPGEIDQAWRRIDHDWLSTGGELAMQLDSKTNNTSLVLAFELVDTQRVFLFAADAQIGNWLSWQDTVWTLGNGIKVSGPDLLARTVYYKVGHHGSQNATLEGKGLELMTSPDLASFIPTNKADALKVKWGEMPFHGILDALERRCGKRVVRADDPWLAHGNPPFHTPSGCVQAVRSGTSSAQSHEPRQFWVEFDLM